MQKPRIKSGCYSKYVVYLVVICVLLNFLYLLFGTQLWSSANDPGLGWHLKSGQDILHTYQIPEKDVFLVNTDSKLWISNQWLADLILASLYELGSWQLIYIFVATIFLWALWFKLIHYGLNNSNTPILIMLIGLFAINIHFFHFVIRPVFFQLILFILFFINCNTLYQIARKEARSKEFTKLLYIQALLILLWTNLHPSFLLGLDMLGILVFTLLAEFIFKKQYYKIKEYLIPVCYLPLVSLINPYGFELHRFIVKYMTLSYTRVQTEWHALTTNDEAFFYFSVLLSAFFAVLFLARKTYKEWNYFSIISTVCFIILTLSAQRYITFFAVSVFISIVSLIKLLPSQLNKLLEYGNEYTQEVLSFSKKIALCAVLLFVMLFSLKPNLFSNTLGPDPKIFPFQAISFLNSISKDRESPLKILNDPDWGGFITFYGSNMQAVMDDRYYLFNEEYIKNYTKLFYAPNEKVFSKIKTNDLDYILASREELLAQWLEKEKPEGVVYRDEVAVVWGEFKR